MDVLMAPPPKDQVATEIRQELRSIVRQWEDLSKPLSRFETVPDRPEGTPRHYIMFDMNPRRIVTGLQISPKTVSLPDERIRDAFFHVAKAVWHLKDRLILWAWSAGAARDRQHAKHLVHAIPGGCVELRICTDLANKKKHGENQNRSGLSPDLSKVRFDISNSVPIELYYDGATKHKEILVTNPTPISYTLDVITDPDKSVFGDAADVLKTGFDAWLPLIDDMDVLTGDNPETKSLRRILYPDATT
ncbi:MAG: hypothetical protein HQ581_23230 [Planctomycetes bacterium]|nr:hypothetical protein [Planctomycetota bacterium]